jgi:hypothetical protein
VGFSAIHEADHARVASALTKQEETMNGKLEKVIDGDALEAVMDEQTKHCPGCGEDLPVSVFGKDRSRPDGFACYCLKCKCEKIKEHYRRGRFPGPLREEEKKLKCAGCGKRFGYSGGLAWHVRQNCPAGKRKAAGA